MLRFLLRTVLLAFLVSGCSTLRDRSVGSWPEHLPPVDVFVNAYESDTTLQEYQTLDSYLYWVQAFYEGTALYPRGWSDVSEAILESASSAQEAAVWEKRLFELGCDISVEWSKETSINRIKSSNLAVWGNAVERSVGEGNVEATLTRIADDVQRLLSLQLTPDDITADRYHEPDPDDWFAL